MTIVLMNFFIMSRIVDVISHVFSITLLDRIGRRIFFSGGMLLTGAACLASGLVPQGKFDILFTTFLSLE